MSISPKVVLTQIALNAVVGELTHAEQLELFHAEFRAAAYAPIEVDGEEIYPADFVCFDNGGKTIDRYTIYPDASEDDCLGVDGNGGRTYSQWGTGNCVGMMTESPNADNFLINWHTLPVDTLIHVRKRIGEPS